MTMHPPPVDYGTLSIENVTVTETEESELKATFSKTEYVGDITYSYDSDAFTIENGKVKGIKACSAVTVTAKTAHHETTFTVTVEAIDYGTLSIENVTVTETEESELKATFSKTEYVGDITYSYDSDAFTIENGKVKGIKACSAVTVTAKTAHHETTFTVTVETVDYGTLSIKDIEGLSTASNRAKIMYSFSNKKYAEEITYSFEGNDIKIEGGYVTALVGGKTVIVTAKTSHHETTFKVSTLVDYGSLVIDDIYAWIGYPESPIDIKFEFEDKKETLTFSYDKTKLEIDEQKLTVKALVAGEHVVNATSEHFNARFVVKCENVDKNATCYDTTGYNDYVKTLKSKYEKDGNDGNTTLFIGDSFFDVRYFWTDFYRTYAGKDALCFGISSTTSYDWEIFTESFLKYTAPKNIVMHIGTNNVYDDKNSANEAVSALQRMFLVMHEELPNTKIYWFNISQRSYGNDEISKVFSVNSEMKSWCENRSWLTYIDTSSKLTNDMLKDNVHPKLENYSVFVNALKSTDIEIADAQLKESVDFNDVTGNASTALFDKDNGTVKLASTNRARYYLVDGNDYYCGNFAVSGSMKVSGTGWAELLVNSAANNGWFLASSALPVSNIVFNDGRSEIWGNYSEGKKESLTNVSNGQFEFTVIVYNGSVLFKINDSVKVYEDAALSGAYFAFGAENVSVEVSSLKIVVNDNEAVRAKYDQTAPVPSASIDDIVRDKSQKIGNGEKTIVYKNETLNRNYILSGKIDITDKETNGHIHFKFNGDNNRILIWDNKSQDKWKIGWACASGYNSDAPQNAVYERESGTTLTLEWKLVVTDSDAYFYVNGDLKLVWKNLSGTSLTISSENTTCKIYAMKGLSLKNDKTEYEAEIEKMKETIETYKNTASGVTRV